jgi:butyryl-CoA dehydrogenase
MRQLSGKVAAITGAGSGMGRALALDLTAMSCHVALADVDGEALAGTASDCQGRGVKVSESVVDVADRDAVHAWADQVAAEHGRVNLVVNNAGVALMYDVETMSYEDLDWLIGVNFWGVIHGTKAFLPHLRAADEGHIVNVSSVFGLIGVPSQSAYSAAKFAVRGFTDALRLELKGDAGNVSCTTVHPGGVRTNIARNARSDPNGLSVRSLGGRDQADVFDRMVRTSPEQAARAIIRAVERDRRRVTIGADAKVIDLVSRLPSAVYHWPVIGGLRVGRRFLKPS